MGSSRRYARLWRHDACMSKMIISVVNSEMGRMLCHLDSSSHLGTCWLMSVWLSSQNWSRSPLTSSCDASATVLLSRGLLVPLPLRGLKILKAHEVVSSTFPPLAGRDGDSGHELGDRGPEPGDEGTLSVSMSCLSCSSSSSLLETVRSITSYGFSPPLSFFSQ